MLQDIHLRQTIMQTANRIVRHQRPDGAFSFCCEVAPLSDAVMIIFLILLSYKTDPLIPPLCDGLLERQNSDGGWTAYPDEPENVSTTSLALFALRLAGYSPELPSLMAAKRYVLQHGGIHAAANLAKVIFATAGELSWDSLPGVPIELALLGPSAPVSLFDLASFARLHLVPYMVLTHVRFQRIPERKKLADLLTPGTEIPKFHLPYRNQPALERCETFILGRLEPNGTLASYLTATVFAVFALLAMGYPAKHPIILRAVRGLKEMVYIRRKSQIQSVEPPVGQVANHMGPPSPNQLAGLSVHQQIFTSTVWDTALSVQALQATHLSACSAPIHKGVSYLTTRQHTRFSDWHVHAPYLKPGGWGFSDVDTLYPDLDDTIATLKALYPFRNTSHSSWRNWRRGVIWTLGMQNDDGGFAAFERNCNKTWLEHIPVNDIGRAMTDPSTADLTGRVLEALAEMRVPARETISQARRWLLKQQRPDGSWFGRWGICYIYGTWAALIGLRAAGIPSNHPSIHKGIAWLEEIQNPDGGFGESCRSERSDGYVALGHSTPSQSAWALMALLAACPSDTRPIERAVTYLLTTGSPKGGWSESYPTGTGIAGLAYLRYDSYPHLWPLLSLSQYSAKNREM